VLLGSKKKMKQIDYILIENLFGNHYKKQNFQTLKKYLIKNDYKILKKFISPTLHYQDILFKKKV